MIYYSYQDFPVIIVIVNMLSLLGLIILYFGLEVHLGEKISFLPNSLLFVIAIGSIIFFTYFRPSMRARLITSAAANSLIWLQTSTLIFFRSPSLQRRIGHQLGTITLLLAVVNLFRIAALLNINPGRNFFSSHDVVVWSFLFGVIFFFGLTFSLQNLLVQCLNLKLEGDIKKRKKIEVEHEKTIRDLESALNNVKTLHGLIPICSYCKKIRDDEGSWNQLEEYVAEHSDAEFTHGICDECAKKHLDEMRKNKSG